MRHPDGLQKLVLAVLVISSALVIIVGAAWGLRQLAMSRSSQTTVQPVNNVANGFPMSGKPAPDFSLIDQFGHSTTLSSLRGHEVVLAFIDSRCKSLCPLTATIMYEARARLGSSAASKVALVAVNANPVATSIAEVQAWSIDHGMLHQWSFLTGTSQQLQAVYHQYNLYDQVDASGAVTHDPATLIIDANGHERLYFETLDSNSNADLSSQEGGLEAGMRQWLP